MKPLRLLRWSGTVLSPRIRLSPLTRPCSIHQHLSFPSSTRTQSSIASIFESEPDNPTEDSPTPADSPSSNPPDLLSMPSPPPYRALESAKLAALHARLSLSPRLPFETLARCLIHSTADPDPRFNNTSLAVLGSSLLSYYTSEAVLCRFPRLPTEVVFATMWAYCGPKILGVITREWGVEVAAEPGGEVDAGFLQCRRLEAKDHTGRSDMPEVVKETSSTLRPNANKGWRVGVSSRTIYDNQFGDETRAHGPQQNAAHEVVPLEEACASFVNALVGAVYLHLGRRAAKRFFTEHIMSRHLDVSRVFEFRQPARDLSRLLAREGLESPVARIKSETGRASRHPVFVVGVYSGRDELGEGQGASLDEARFRAAAAALRSWYLYSPLEVRVPSEALENDAKKWEPLMVDMGEIIV
ncbi:MAG: hypothetical protein Q9195_005482 [Heterodermia aff. obscurata]